MRPTAVRRVEVAAGDLFYEPTQLSAASGSVAITLDNQGAIKHDVVIEEAGDTLVAQAPRGEQGTGTITLDAGAYTFLLRGPGPPRRWDGGHAHR